MCFTLNCKFEDSFENCTISDFDKFKEENRNEACDVGCGITQYNCMCCTYPLAFEDFNRLKYTDEFNNVIVLCDNCLMKKEIEHREFLEEQRGY